MRRNVASPSNMTACCKCWWSKASRSGHVTPVAQCVVSNWTNPDTGEVIRPDLAIIDDLETRETARSKTQTGQDRNMVVL